MMPRLLYRILLTKVQRIISSAILITHGIWAVPIVFIIRLIHPWRTIRLGTIRCDRIGHFAADSGHQLGMLHLKEKQFVDLYWLPVNTCNKFFSELVCRHLSVHWWVRPLDYWNRWIPGGADHWRPSSITKSRDLDGYLERAGVKFSFLPRESEDGKKWLRDRGWREGEQFVCLLVRDSAYLDHAMTQENGYWKYHEFRDTDITDYESAILWLAEKGIWVLRMGKIMAKPLKIKHTKIIDYAFDLDRSDFLDVWLFANCDFCISTGSGPDAISDIFRRPLLLLNYIPLRDMFSWSYALHFPKKLFWQNNGYQLSLSDYIEHSYLSADEYHRAGIKIKDLSSENIQDAVQEMWSRLQGTWHDTDYSEKCNELFWRVFRN